MSKSLKRVARALEDAGLDTDILEMPGTTRTAQDAAAEAGCTLDQIAKSIIFQDPESGSLVLFITAGGNTVDPAKAARCAGHALERADARAVRDRTGFAIGGVSPVGHLSPVRAFFDPRLESFATVWAAAGTPRHIFQIAPGDLLRLTGASRADFTADLAETAGDAGM